MALAMKKLLAAALLLAAAMAGEAALAGGGRVSFGFSFGFPGPWYYPPPYSYPPAYSPAYAYSAEPTTYIEQEPQSPSNWWYYCPEARAYYPYVRECAESWQRVSPTPPPR